MEAHRVASTRVWEVSLQHCHNIFMVEGRRPLKKSVHPNDNGTFNTGHSPSIYRKDTATRHKVVQELALIS